MRKNQIIQIQTIILTCFLLFSFNSFSQKVFIKNGDAWSYYDNGYLESNWFEKQNYQDWKIGESPLGYGDRSIVTKLSFGGDEENKELIKYFTKEINIKEVSKYKGFEFKLRRDDGAIIYVNGKELYRDNMPQGHVTKLTKPLEVINSKEEKLFYTKIFDASIFKNGMNTINVQVHQYNERSSDCIFSLEVIGHTDANILTEVVKAQIETKTSLETKIDALNYNFILKNTTTQLDIYKNSYRNTLIILTIVGGLLIITIIGSFIVYFKNRKN